LDVGPHTLGQRVEEAAGKRNPSVMDPVFGLRPDPVDDPSALAYHRRLGTQLEREILEVRVGRVGNDKIGDDRHVALVRRKRNSLGKLRPDFGFHQRCVHLHTLEDGSRVAERIRDFRLLGAACADIGEYFLAISNAIARNSALSDGGSSTSTRSPNPSSHQRSSLVFGTVARRTTSWSRRSRRWSAEISRSYRCAAVFSSNAATSRIFSSSMGYAKRSSSM